METCLRTRRLRHDGRSVVLAIRPTPNYEVCAIAAADGLGQCAAEMVAAQRFNAAAGKPIDPIYGCVTTGMNWRFLRLTGSTLDIDIDESGISQPDRILGVLLHCCGVAV